MALRARIYAYNRHLSFDVAFICSTLTHCGVCHLSVWRLKWEVSYVHQRVWRWKWFFYQSNHVLQRLRLGRTSDTVFPTWNRFTAAVGLWNMLWWYSFPTAKECSVTHTFPLTSTSSSHHTISIHIYTFFTVTYGKKKREKAKTKKHKFRSIRFICLAHSRQYAVGLRSVHQTVANGYIMI